MQAAFTALPLHSVLRPGEADKEAERRAPHFRTRGVVLAPEELTTWNWPQKAKAAGLTTIGTHVTPRQVAAFISSDKGQEFLETCRKLELGVEHELHAMSDLLPRELFEKDTTMFRMNEKGERVPDANLCVHSRAALQIVCENAVRYAQTLRPTTGRYFYWVDDAKPMCQCPKCRELSPSDQALILENEVVGALCQDDPRAKLAHLAYLQTLSPPTQVKPNPQVFLEFAPIQRRHDRPLGRREAKAPQAGSPTHGEHLDLLDANLAVFGTDDAQALEYWLDLSRFSSWRRENVATLPWDRQVFLDDLQTYAARGVRHVTSFGVWIDGSYVDRFGEPPLTEYGAGLLTSAKPGPN